MFQRVSRIKTISDIEQIVLHSDDLKQHWLKSEAEKI